MSDLPLARSGRTALEVATQAAREAGEILRANFYSKQEVRYKGKSNLVTETDILSEQSILNLLNREFPDHTILSEESHSSSLINGYSWIIDPLDGTNNYVFGIPFFCVNIALVKNDDILIGITYDPMREEFFRAEKKMGAYLNDSVMQVSTKNSLQESLVGFDIGYSDVRGKEIFDIAHKLWGQVHCLRVLGSAALGLAYVACGRINLYFHRWLYPWDIASGLLLVGEAGGKATDWQGNAAKVQDKEIICSNHKVHNEFIEYMTQYRYMN